MNRIWEDVDQSEKPVYIPPTTRPYQFESKRRSFTAQGLVASSTPATFGSPRRMPPTATLCWFRNDWMVGMDHRPQRYIGRFRFILHNTISFIHCLFIQFSRLQCILLYWNMLLSTRPESKTDQSRHSPVDCPRTEFSRIGWSAVLRSQSFVIAVAAVLRRKR